MYEFLLTVLKFILFKHAVVLPEHQQYVQL